MRVVATAGHVDHGKSSLVLALTGTDPDRFEEEKRRGLTIDLGFAHTMLPGGSAVSFIDVPGHVRFLRNMLAGVGGVDACLFVVAATEGWKPQTEEHLRILELLGVRHGVVALTKVDLVDDDWRELAILDVGDHVAGTFLHDAPIVPVAAPTGEGLDDLRAALADLVASTPAAHDGGRPRLWIDRVFAAKGSGTIVTGTLTGGGLAVDDQVAVATRTGIRIRGMQSLNSAVTEIGPGNRVALNLAGLEHNEAARGQTAVKPDQWWPTDRFDATLHVLDSLDHDVQRRGAYAVYIGSGEFAAKVRLLGTGSIAPGATGVARIQLPHRLPLLPGDRYVLRESGRAETVGGGEVLDIHPVLPASRAQPDRDPDRIVSERGWVTAAEYELLTGVRRAPVLGPWIASEATISALLESVRGMIDCAGPLGLDLAALDVRERLAVDTLDGVEMSGGRARRSGAADPLADHPFVLSLREAPFAPPDPQGVDRGELRELVRRGLIVERDGIYFHPQSLDEAARVAACLLAENAAGFTVAQFRDATRSTRKIALPLLAELDARAVVTRRRDDLRVAGPRLPAI